MFVRWTLHILYVILVGKYLYLSDIYYTHKNHPFQNTRDVNDNGNKKDEKKTTDIILWHVQIMQLYTMKIYSILLYEYVVLVIDTTVSHNIIMRLLQ